MTHEEYNREQFALSILGTPWNVSPPFDLVDFLTCCWLWIEFQNMQQVRYLRPHFEGFEADRT